MTVQLRAGIPTRRPALFVFKSNRGGFTLIEVVIAFTVLVVSLVALLAALANNMKINEANREATLVEEAINDKFAEIRAHTFDDIVPDYSAGGTPGGTFTVAGVNDGIGTITIDNNNPYLLDIAITITWSGVYGDNQTQKDQTMITR